MQKIVGICGEKDLYWGMHMGQGKLCVYSVLLGQPVPNSYISTKHIY